MLLVLLRRLAEHHQIVQVGEGVLQVAGHPVHFPLERIARVAEPKGEPQELEKTKRCCNGGLLRRVLAAGGSLPSVAGDPGGAFKPATPEAMEEMVDNS